MKRLLTLLFVLALCLMTVGSAIAYNGLISYGSRYTTGYKAYGNTYYSFTYASTLGMPAYNDYRLGYPPESFGYSRAWYNPQAYGHNYPFQRPYMVAPN